MSDTPPIPARLRGTCAFCGKELNIEAEGTHQWVAGWVKNREGGGGHGLSLRKPENRWAHPWCIERASKGYTNQTTMF